MTVQASLLLLSSFALLLVVGVPIAICIAVSSIVTVLLISPFDGSVFTAAQKMITSLDTFSLLAVPFFILAGVIMNNGGIALRLVNFAKLVSGRAPGALAQTNVVGNMLFGALSGSAIAASTSIGGVMVPMGVKEGYDARFSAAANIASAPTGMLIPPTTSFIIFAIISGGTSVAALFMGGAVAGALWGLGVMVVTHIIARRHGYAAAERIPASMVLKVIVDALPSLLMIVIVIGGIVAGVFTAIEASAVAVLYTALLAFGLYRTLPLSRLPSVLVQTAEMTGIIMFLLAASSAMSFAMAYTGIPQALSELILAISQDKLVVLLIINIMLLVVGTFLDIGPAILIFTPILLPIATKVGVDPVHFGVILVFNLCIGTITPPVGTGLFVGASVARLRIEQVIRPLLPFYAAIIAVLMLVTYVPALTLALPRALGL
ncbi:MAG: TRAP transporter large permease [Rhodocyclaceae bacterium]